MTPPERVRMLVLHSSNELYGSDKVLLSLLRGLKRRQFDPIVVLPNDVPGGGILAELLANAGVEVHVRGLAVLRRRYLNLWGVGRLSVRTLADLWYLGTLARRRRIDVVYTSTTAVQSGAIVARLMRLPHVWHVHEMLERPKLVARLLRWNVTHLSTRIVVVSHAVSRWIGNATPQIDVIPNGFDSSQVDSEFREEMRQRLLGSGTGPLIGWVGRLSPWKGQEVFVAMAHLAAAHLPDARFVIAGGAVPGREDLIVDLKKQIEGSVFSDRIQYVGHVASGPSFIAALDVLVCCPTMPDPAPLVALEALSLGVPVLAVRSGGLPEIITEDQTGVLVEHSEPLALVAGLNRLIDPTVRARMSKAARIRSAERFSLTAFVSRTETVLLRATQQGRKS